MAYSKYNGAELGKDTLSSIGAAAQNHNHDADYADIGHNHDADYADIGHNHDADYAAVKFFTATVAGANGSSDWVGTDPSVATITVSGILATDQPIISLDISGEGVDDGIFLQRVWNLVYRAEASADNEIKLYAIDEPLADLNLNIKVVR